MSARRRIDAYMIGQLIAKHKQLFIIGARHFYVNVVVPRNKALIAHGSKERATVHIVAESMFFAQLVKLKQYIKLDMLHLS